MEITVRAQATGRRQPELATLWLTIAQEADNQEEASRRATGLARQVVAEIDRAADTGSFSQRVVLPVSTRSWRPWNDQGVQLPLRYAATARAMVETTDVELLSRLAGRLAAIEGVSLTSPEWELSQEGRRELEAELLREAIGQARARAEVMAEASGFSTLTPLQLADTGLLGQGMDAAPMMMARSAKGVSDEGLDLTPQEIELEVTVEARFRAG